MKVDLVVLRTVAGNGINEFAGYVVLGCGYLATILHIDTVRILSVCAGYLFCCNWLSGIMAVGKRYHCLCNT